MFKQESSPLYSAFFSEENADRVQLGIQNEVQNSIGVRVDKQNPADLFAIMASVYSVNVMNAYGNVGQQVQNMNRITVSKAAEQVVSGIRSYQMYIKDISSRPVPNSLPVSTSSYGKKLGAQNFGV